MKPDIHPKYSEITVTCSCGKKFKVGSTLGKDLLIEVCDKCHPFYSGQQKIVDTTGRVEKYKSRYETPRTVQVQPPKPPVKKEVKKTRKKVMVEPKKVEKPVKKEVKKTKPITKPKEKKETTTKKTTGTKK